MNEVMKELQTAADGAGLEMEFLELKRDAERYRWLRAGKARTTGLPREGRIEVMRWDDANQGAILKSDLLDAAVDAAMQRVPRVGAVATETDDLTLAMREAGYAAWMRSTAATLDSDPGPERDGPHANIAAAYRAMRAVKFGAA